MLFNYQIFLMIQESVNHVNGISRVGIDDFPVKAGELVANESVNRSTLAGTVVGFASAWSAATPSYGN